MFLSPLSLVSAISRQFPEALFYQPTTQPVIALTIDDVGDASTQQIINVIADYNQKIAGISRGVNATFFITTHHLKNNYGILETILKHNYEIGNHGIYDRTHADLNPDEFAQEFQQAHETLTRDTKAVVKWFRPGRGRYNQTMVKTLSQMAKNAGYYPLFALASMIPLDTFQFTNYPQFTTRYVSQFIFPGAILVLHGGSISRSRQTVTALKHILSYCDRHHYRVVSLSELYEQF
ncbi:MAG: polysaccharide deacetylase family protein [Microcoleaceae cyanobacterium]